MKFDTALRTTVLLTTLVATALARPLHTPHLQQMLNRAIPPAPQSRTLTLEGLLEIAPAAASCDGAPFPGECATASDALPLILASFDRYGITHPPTQAALVSLMAYESGEFRYNVNHDPGVPGQGTRNMQSPADNRLYAADLGYGADVTEGDDLQALTAAVGAPQHTFGSAAWYLSTQCARHFRTGLWDGSQIAWEAYLTDCVGTTYSDERLAYWSRAMKVLTGDSA